MPVPTCSEFQFRTSPAASTRFAAVPDRVTVFGTNATVLTPLVSASDATDVDPDPAAPLLMTDTVRLLVFAPVIADGVTYCTDVTVAGERRHEHRRIGVGATAHRSGDDMPGTRVGSLVSHQAFPLSVSGVGFPDVKPCTV
jgi:hypothetical protein